MYFIGRKRLAWGAQSVPAKSTTVCTTVCSSRGAASPDRGQPLSLKECCNNVTDPVSDAGERNLLYSNMLHIAGRGLQPQLPYLLALRSCSNADAFMKPLQAGALQALL